MTGYDEEAGVCIKSKADRAAKNLTANFLLFIINSFLEDLFSCLSYLVLLPTMLP